MRIEYFVETPETRKFAELAIDFVTRVVKRDVLNRLTGIAVIETLETYEDTEKVIADACKAINAPPLGCKGVISDIYRVFNLYGPYEMHYGAHLPGRVERMSPAIIWVLPRGATPNAHDSYVLFHELAHHMVYAYDENVVFTETWIADALAADVGFDRLLESLHSLKEKPLTVPGRGAIAEELTKLRTLENRELESLIEDVSKLFIEFVNEATATTIGVNYFLLLNTRPFLRPIMFSYLRLFGIATDSPFKACIDLVGVIKDIVADLRSYPKNDIKSIIAEADDVINRFFSNNMIRFATVVHSIFESCVTTMPKNVYLQEPDRYAPLFIGLDWNIVMNTLGLPVMDKRW